MPHSSGSISAAGDPLATSVQDSVRPIEGSAPSAHDLVAFAHSVPVSTLRLGDFQGAFPVHVASPAAGRLNAHAGIALEG
jgi:hypothetical protein